jgi:hypothetical protein
MLAAAHYSAALPYSDLERAKSFYADKLGLTPADEQLGRLSYQGRNGAEFVLLPVGGRHTVLHPDRPQRRRYQH